MQSRFAVVVFFWYCIRILLISTIDLWNHVRISGHKSVLESFLTFFSMGGAIAVHVASQHFLPSLIGLCVIDVVEGQYVFCWIMTHLYKASTFDFTLKKRIDRWIVIHQIIIIICLYEYIYLSLFNSKNIEIL